MGRHIRKIGPKTWVIFSLGIWLAALVGVKASAPQASQAAPPPAPKSQSAVTPPQASSQGTVALVGEDTCVTCHDDKKHGIEISRHGVKADDRTPAAKQSCETCHGPGGKHAEDPSKYPLIRFSKEKPETINNVCATCHNRGEHALWSDSQHERRGLSCITCHSVHAPKSDVAQLKMRNQLETCAVCHRDKISKLDRSGHMPVREGKMQCTSCHNVHGATNVRLLRKGDSPTELCTSCHAEKRGPFLWEHPPSRDGCTTCHDPHGTVNERMLITKPPLLCQRCHIHTKHPSTIYDALLMGPTTPAPSARVYGRSCVTCHAAIHGSNHPSGQRFIR